MYNFIDWSNIMPKKKQKLGNLINETEYFYRDQEMMRTEIESEAKEKDEEQKLLGKTFRLLSENEEVVFPELHIGIGVFCFCRAEEKSSTRL